MVRMGGPTISSYRRCVRENGGVQSGLIYIRARRRGGSSLAANLVIPTLLRRTAVGWGQTISTHIARPLSAAIYDTGFSLTVHVEKKGGDVPSE